MGIESASRIEQVVGGKRQRRKRIKRVVVKVQRKKKKGAPRASEHNNTCARLSGNEQLTNLVVFALKSLKNAPLPTTRRITEL